ncbi:MAG: hypothetical protein LAT62_06865 [Natronospirillum sp.]|uniref:TIM-barrel domain-containing protein n=1 Tax=Natronospirillum sp. TaxID=2812955 RepID=UPI0025D40DE4|nr:TIM-barrel domain-containing protein [Natronospirillum sp.]MCH8551638.1 hypothetical protein [Natronospirillum sp.]
MWPRLLWLSLLLVFLFSMIFWFRTTPGWVDSGQLDTAWTTDREWTLDLITVRWDSTREQLSVHHSDRIAWASTPGQSWMGVMSGELPDLRRLNTGRLGRSARGCQHQFWYDAAAGSEFLELQGTLQCDGEELSATLEIRSDQSGDVQLDWSLTDVGDRAVQGLALVFELPSSEYVFGFGQQTTGLDRQGSRVALQAGPARTSRAGQPSASLWPLGVTSQSRALIAPTSAHQIMDLQHEQSARLEVWGARAGTLQVLLGDDPRHLQTRLASVVGTMPGLPEALHRKPVLGASGDAGAVLAMLDQLAEEETPLSAILLELPKRDGTPASVDMMPWRPGSFELEQADWPALTERLRQSDLGLLGSRNPLMTPLEIDNVLLSSSLTGDELTDTVTAEALPLDTATGRNMLRLDVGRDSVRAWLRQSSEDSSRSEVTGWLAEWYVPAGTVSPDALQLAAERTAQQDWHAWQLEDGQPLVVDAEPFPGQSGTPRPGMVSTGHHAAGWGPSTGLQASLSALLSGGVSGLTIAHSPVGGSWTSSQLWWPRYRDTELFLRWLELSTFTAWLRLHEGDEPARHYQVTDSVSGLIHFDRLARLYEALFPYRQQLMQEAAQSGWPIVRPLWFTFPEDEQAWSLPADQFMLGDYLLVVPVLESGVTEREFYLPSGQWTHLWDRRTFDSDGEFLRLRTPIGEPLVLVHEDFPYHNDLLAQAAELAIGNILGSF